MVAGGGYNVSLKTLLSAFTVVGVVISFLSFNIGRASVVSDFRKEIQEKYVERVQYSIDQNQQAQTIQRNYTELMKQLDSLREDQRSIILLLTRNRKMAADSLLAGPD